MKRGTLVCAGLMLGAIGVSQNGAIPALAYLQIGREMAPIEFVSRGENSGYEQEPGSPSSFKRAGKAKYKNIVLKRGFVNDASLIEWYKKTLAGTTDRKSGSVIYLDREGGEVSRYNFFEAWPCRWKAPELNSSSDTHVAWEITLATPFPVEGSANKAIRAVGKHKGDYLPAHNFKLEIDGVISGGFRIEPVTISIAEPGMERVVLDDDCDDTSSVRVSSINITFPESETEYLLAWRKILDRGEAGDVKLERTIKVHTWSNQGVAMTMTYPRCVLYGMEQLGDGSVRCKIFTNGVPEIS